MHFDALKATLASGLLSFPVTDFDEAGRFDETPYRARVAWMAGFSPAALFAAGGTGEFFSLTVEEHRTVTRAAVDATGGKFPIIGSAGGILANAIEQARAAEKAGAAGLLLFPHYLTETCTDGMLAYAQAICDAVGIGVIVYNRGTFRLDGDALAQLAERCDNFIGVKDGTGDLELVIGIRAKLGDRVGYFGGLPTAEFFAAPYKAAGVPTYSSAVFNFIPQTALTFFRALHQGDEATMQRLMTDFFVPYAAIRNRRKGYAVSIVKAGVRLRGRPAGRVRAPLVDLTPEEERALGELLDAQQLN